MDLLYLKENYKIDMLLKSMNLGHLTHNFSKKGVTLDTFLNLKEEDLDYIGIKKKEERKIILRDIEAYQHNYKDIRNPPEFSRIVMLSTSLKQLKMISSMLLSLKSHLVKDSQVNFLIDDSTSVATGMQVFLKTSMRQLDLIQSDIQPELHKYRQVKEKDIFGKPIFFFSFVILSAGFMGILFSKLMRSS